MLDERFVYLAVLLNLLGGASYLIGTIKGSVTPNRVTWFLWGVAPMIAFAAEMQQGIGLPALMTFMVGFNPILIFVASFIGKRAVWRLGWVDVACGALSVAGLALWYATRDGNVAIVFSIVADALAGGPTIIKAFAAPSTEDHRTFLLAASSGAITLLTLDQWNLATAAFPAYILMISALLFALIRFNARIRAFGRRLASAMA